MHITGALPKEMRRQVPMALGLVGLSKKADAYPDELSGANSKGWP